MNHPFHSSGLSAYKGFTLVEMAVVLVIIGLMLGGLLVPLSAQLDIRNSAATQKSLETAKEALLGFAVANGRLPCPATDSSDGVEAFAAGGNATNGNCAVFNNGFLPAATLGITPIDSQGYALDGWGGQSQNRIRYAVTSANTNAFTLTNGMQNTGMGSLVPELRVCASASGITATRCSGGTESNYLVNTAVAVIYSVGKNAASGGTSADESANPNPNSADNDIVFVSHEPAPAPNEFDDMVTWISPNVLYNRMVAAGKLP